MKVKTFKKVSTQGENVCLSAARDEIPSHLVTNELIYQKNIGNEPAAGMTNHMREGMITLHVLACVLSLPSAAAFIFFTLVFSF